MQVPIVIESEKKEGHFPCKEPSLPAWRGNKPNAKSRLDDCELASPYYARRGDWLLWTGSFWVGTAVSPCDMIWGVVSPF